MLTHNIFLEPTIILPPTSLIMPCVTTREETRSVALKGKWYTKKAEYKRIEAASILIKNLATQVEVLSNAYLNFYYYKKLNEGLPLSHSF
jgi:hypothetical protein